MWFADMSPCTYFGAAGGASLRAVGWLERGRDFPTGPAAPPFVEKLRALLADAFAPVRCCGVHACDLCQFDGPTASGTLWIPSDDVIFVSPELILHYVCAHWYSPPEPFQHAVIACPPTRSIEYKRRYLAAGGRGIERLLRP